MKKCQNCGKTLNAFTAQFGLVGDPDESLCAACRTVLLSFINDLDLSDDFEDKYADEIKKYGISQGGVEHIRKYLDGINLSERRVKEKHIAQESAFLNTAKESLSIDDDYKQLAIETMRNSGADGYYEYNVQSLYDEWGKTNIEKLNDLLNRMALAGWRLVSTHVNELGKNALALVGFGINSTVDETVLVFERYVKLN